MYMRRKVCHGDRIAIADRTRGCRVDSPQYGQQYMLLCRHRLFGPDFALWKGCIYEFAQCIQDKRVVTGEEEIQMRFLILIHKCFHILLIFWKTFYYVPSHISYSNIIDDTVYKPIYQKVNDIYTFHEEKLSSTFGMKLLDINHYIPLLYWTQNNINVQTSSGLLQVHQNVVINNLLYIFHSHWNA